MHPASPAWRGPDAAASRLPRRPTLIGGGLEGEDAREATGALLGSGVFSKERWYSTVHGVRLQLLQRLDPFVAPKYTRTQSSIMADISHGIGGLGRARGPVTFSVDKASVLPCSACQVNGR